MQQSLDELVHVPEYVEFTWEGKVIHDVRRHHLDQPISRVADEPSSEGHSELDGERGGFAAAPRAPRSLCQPEPEKDIQPEISDHYVVIYPPHSKRGLLLCTDNLLHGGRWLLDNPAQDWQVFDTENGETVAFSDHLRQMTKVDYS